MELDLDVVFLPTSRSPAGHWAVTAKAAWPNSHRIERPSYAFPNARPKGGTDLAGGVRSPWKSVRSQQIDPQILRKSLFERLVLYLIVPNSQFLWPEHLDDFFNSETAMCAPVFRQC